MYLSLYIDLIIQKNSKCFLYYDQGLNVYKLFGAKAQMNN